MTDQECPYNAAHDPRHPKEFTTKDLLRFALNDVTPQPEIRAVTVRERNFLVLSKGQSSAPQQLRQPRKTLNLMAV